MKQKLKDIFKGPVVFYPLLFAAFPILFLYVYNISETSVSQIWLPLVISVAATLVLWVVLSLILRSLAKAGFATAIFLVIFFSYGRLYAVLETWGVVPKDAYLFSTTLFIWGYCVYFIGRAKRDFRITTRLFNITAVVLIAINLFNIVSYQVKVAGLSTDAAVESTEHTAAASPAELNTPPDIYFIILDEYAHPDTMKEWYDYDNSEFINSLKDKGVFVGDKSETPSGSTGIAISSRLNMGHLYVSEVEAFLGLVNSEVVNFLRAEGYKYVYFGNQYEFGRYGIQADYYYNYYEYKSSVQRALVSEFSQILLDTTLLRPFQRHFVGFSSYHREAILYTLEHLQKVPEEVEGPKFVFVHFLCPHEPFVFGPRGEIIPPANWRDYSDKQYYLGNYIFISTEIEKVVDVLLKKSETPPIIILQSDHGLRPHPGLVIGDSEWKKILNAMYLPGMDYDILSDNISVGNTFRLIFDHYFGADYPLLEDDQKQ